jgi:hypothetical protein
MIIERLLIEDFMAVPPENRSNYYAWLEVIIVTVSRLKNSSVGLGYRKHAPFVEADRASPFSINKIIPRWGGQLLVFSLPSKKRRFVLSL